MKRNFTRSLFAIGALVTLTLGAGQVHADKIKSSQEAKGWGQNSDKSYSVTLKYDDLCVDNAKKGSIKFWACGDFYYNKQYVKVTANKGTANEVNFGKWLNGNTGDDYIHAPKNDWGEDFKMVYGSTSLYDATLAKLIGDGSFSLTFEFSKYVEPAPKWSEGSIIGAEICYYADCDPTPVIPTPAAAGMGLVSLGLMAARRRREA